MSKHRPSISFERHPRSPKPPTEEGRTARTNFDNFFIIPDESLAATILGLRCDGHCQVCPNPCEAQQGVLEAATNDRLPH